MNEVTIGTKTYNGRRWHRCRRRGGWERPRCVCAVRGVVEESGEEKVTHNGSSRKCMLSKERTGVVELGRIVRETFISGGVTERKMWYSLKYDRHMLMPLGGAWM